MNKILVLQYILNKYQKYTEVNSMQINLENIHFSLNYKTKYKEFLSGPVARIWCLHCWGPGSIPGWRTKICKVHGEAGKKKRKVI